MLSRSPLFLFLERGGGKAKTRGNPFGEYGTIQNPALAPQMPTYIKDKFRLEKQKHIKDEDKEGKR